MQRPYKIPRSEQEIKRDSFHICVSELENQKLHVLAQAHQESIDWVLREFARLLIRGQAPDRVPLDSPVCWAHSVRCTQVMARDLRRVSKPATQLRRLIETWDVSWPLGSIPRGE